MNPFNSDTSNNELNSAARRLGEIISEAHRIVTFTGAGVSAESGIPTYRGAGGYWTKYDPEKYASIDYFNRDPSYYWRFFRDVRHDTMINAKPNPAHIALARLEQIGKLSAVITQNIDGLHQRAGTRRVLELHGNTLRFYCTKCQNPYGIERVWEMIQTELPPLCELCRSVLRPDVVLFGEFLPDDVVAQAEWEAANCDLMIVIGSSLVVYPAAGIPHSARMNGAKLAIINAEPTPLNHLADYVSRLPAGELLGRLVFSGDADAALFSPHP